ncbi:MAG: amidoligase family protein [Balneolaceae bacterium]|nr:amidoligase family protein [Balneolaceae bacterium]
MILQKPVTLNNKNGDPRKVGFELEFSGLELDKTADLIKELYGGEIIEKHRYEYEVNNTDLGNFRVELDARILRKMADEDTLKKFGLNFEKESILKSVEDFLDKAAKTVVPLEVVMPPISVETIPKLESLRRKLQQHKAEGTKASLMHILGMHINVETPDLEISTLLRYLRSILLVYPWLLQKLNIDITRKLSPFVDPYPGKYVLKVLDVDYSPSKGQFINDYLAYNATRNRPVDFLPILAMLDEEKVNRELEDEKNTPRPTFHYRLPNSNIDNPEWSFTEEWNYWMAVEKLAEDKDLIMKLSKLYRLRAAGSFVSFKKEWAETINIFLEPDE